MVHMKDVDLSCRWGVIKLPSHLGRFIAIFLIAAATLTITQPFVSAASAAGASVIEEVQARNILRCGSNTYEGYAVLGPDGRWKGFMVDFCRATAAAVLGNPDLVEIVPVEANSRFKALQDGVIDVLFDGATVTLGRATELTFSFGPIYLYDGQGFLAHSDLGISQVSDAAGMTVCVIDNTTSLTNLQAYIAKTGLALKPVILKSDQGAWEAFTRHRCDLVTNDRAGLVARRGALGGDTSRITVLPDIISREPLAPLVRDGDKQWLMLITWLVHGLVAAEDQGITQAAVRDGWAKPLNDESAVLLGVEDDHAAALGVRPGWAARAVGAVGNYGEVFERNLGQGSPMKLPRGANALWHDGGLMFGPVFR